MSDPNQSVDAATVSDDSPSLPPVRSVPTVSLDVTDTLRCDKCFFSWDLSGGGDVHVPYPDMEGGEDPWAMRRSDVQQNMAEARDGWLRAAASCDLPSDLSICVSRVTGNPLELSPMCLLYEYSTRMRVLRTPVGLRILTLDVCSSTVAQLQRACHHPHKVQRPCHRHLYQRTRVRSINEGQ
jgi:hypothetical protein